MTTQIKYPRTPHLPWSNWTRDDTVIEDLSAFNCPSLIFEKMDGQNVSMTREKIWARSLESNQHPSLNFVKGLWGSLNYLIPENITICGENMYAKHSIYYDNLESYFLIFNIWDKDYCLSWKDTKKLCENLGLTTVPLLQEINSVSSLIQYHKNIWSSGLLKEKEGYVVRVEDSFGRDKFNKNVAKYVRPNHVQTDIHWTKNWIPNKLENKNLT
jgi:hypothetical protein